MPDVQCGVLHCGGSLTPIYGRRATGECYYTDPETMEERLVFEISVAFPFPVELDALLLQMKRANAQGILCDRSHTFYILDDATVKCVDSETGEEKTYHINVYGGDNSCSLLRQINGF